MMISLEELHISYNKLGDRGAELLSEQITNTKTLKVLTITYNNIGPSGTTAISNALSSNTSLKELHMGGDNFINQDGAKALGRAIINNKTLEKLLLCNGDESSEYLLHTESAIIILKDLCSNNTIIKLCLQFRLRKSDVIMIEKEAEMVNSIRKSRNEHIIDFKIQFDDSQGT